MGANKLAEKYPKRTKTYLPKLSTQAQKFGISMEKSVRSPGCKKVQEQVRKNPAWCYAAVGATL